VLGPDINESSYKFAVNKNKEVRFGIGALKGVGEGAVEAIVRERKANGKFNSIFDLTKRVDLRSANKKTFESLAFAGGFDSFEEVHRAQYFYHENGESPFLEKAIRYGSNHQEQENSAQGSLFGGETAVEIPEPQIPECEPWGRMEKLSKEKDVVGIYLSGHPLDDFQFEIKNFCTARIKELSNLEFAMKRGEMRMAGIVTEAQHRITKNGKPYGVLVLEGYEESFRFMLFSDDYIKFKGYLTQGWFLFVKGKVQKRQWNDELEFKISGIELLSDLKDKMAKHINIKLDYEAVDESMIEWMHELGGEKLGKCTIGFQLIDRENKNVIQLKSRNLQLNLTTELLEKLDTNNKIAYSVE